MVISAVGNVAAFIEQLRRIGSNPGRFSLVPRRNKFKTPLSLGLTVENCRQEILKLEVADYSCGPERDYDREGDIWVFGKEINGIEVYIKLKIFAVFRNDGNREEHLKCISFHEAETTLRYPHRRN